MVRRGRRRRRRSDKYHSQSVSTETQEGTTSELASRPRLGFGWYLGPGLSLVGTLVGAAKPGGGGNFGAGTWVPPASLKKRGQGQLGGKPSTNRPPSPAPLFPGPGLGGLLCCWSRAEQKQDSAHQRQHTTQRNDETTPSVRYLPTLVVFPLELR